MLIDIARLTGYAAVALVILGGWLFVRNHRAKFEKTPAVLVEIIMACSCALILVAGLFLLAAQSWLAALAALVVAVVTAFLCGLKPSRWKSASKSDADDEGADGETADPHACPTKDTSRPC